MRYWIVMPAAGAGRRFGSAKQYALLGDRTVLETALQVFLDDPQCLGGSLLLAAMIRSAAAGGAASAAAHRGGRWRPRARAFGVQRPARAGRARRRR
jgi:CTP:molybdopterin cytidylyltransferase MocA